MLSERARLSPKPRESRRTDRRMREEPATMNDDVEMLAHAAAVGRALSKRAPNMKSKDACERFAKLGEPVFDTA